MARNRKQLKRTQDNDEPSEVDLQRFVAELKKATKHIRLEPSGEVKGNPFSPSQLKKPDAKLLERQALARKIMEARRAAKKDLTPEAPPAKE